MNTQQSFEQLNPRAVAVVVDPVQRLAFYRLYFVLICSCYNVTITHSVKGKVVIDAFRMIAGQNNLFGLPPTEPRQTTSNIGFLKKPTIQARIHGLDRYLDLQLFLLSCFLTIPAAVSLLNAHACMYVCMFLLVAF